MLHPSNFVNIFFNIVNIIHVLCKAMGTWRPDKVTCFFFFKEKSLLINKQQCWWNNKASTLKSKVHNYKCESKPFKTILYFIPIHHVICNLYHKIKIRQPTFNYDNLSSKYKIKTWTIRLCQFISTIAWLCEYFKTISYKL